MTRTSHLKIGIALLLLALGIRRAWAYLPSWINFWIGDFLWAAMLYFLGLAILGSVDRRRYTAFLIPFCWLVEASQAWHTPWLDAFRETTIGGILLGHGFLWSDVAAYTAGVLVAYWMEGRKN
jgi:hypothetical protein